MKHRINLIREFSIPLVAGVLVALVWGNLWPQGYSRFIRAPFLGNLSFHFLSNDLFMAFFFAIAAAEITKGCLPGGALNPIKKAVNPLLATAGGVLGPIAVYLTLNRLVGSPLLGHGWGVPTATDIAFAWLGARLVFGSSHPAIAYLLLLAIADDAIGLGIIAVFYPDPAHPVALHWLLLTALGMLAAYLLRRLRMKNYWPYLILGGGLSWAGLYHAHLHPALALVCIIPFLPHGRPQSPHLFEEAPEDHSALALFVHEWKIVVDFGMFMFGLANAGVVFAEAGTATWLVFLSLLAGKTCGVFTFGSLGRVLGYPLPDQMRSRELLAAGMVAGIGFTVALFVAGEAFSDLHVQAAAKMGALMSLSAAAAAFLLARQLGVAKVSGVAEGAAAEPRAVESLGEM